MSGEINVGLIGYGFSGLVFHGPLIRAVPQLRLNAVVSSRREQVERLPGVRAVASVRDLLSDQTIQVVVVASPSGTHYEIARDALLAGKHVVVDKPFALTAAEAGEVIALAADRNRILTVFQNRRWDGDYLTVKKLIEGGLLGRVYHYEARYERFRPQLRSGWREKSGPGSGILYDLGVHLIDQALQLFGMPEAVAADIQAQREGAETVDYFHLVLHYGRARAVLHSSMLTVAPGPHFTLHGDAGSFLKYGMDPQEEALKAGATPDGPDWGADSRDLYGELAAADGTRRKVETERGAYQTFYRALAGCVAQGGAPPVDPRSAFQGLQIVEAAMRSAEQRRTVDLTSR